MSDYLNECVNCVDLPTEFPADCAGKLIDQAAEFFNTGDVKDRQCLVHCGLTLLCWGAGRYVNDHDHDDTPQPMFGTQGPPKNVDVAKMRQELLKACPDKRDDENQSREKVAVTQSGVESAQEVGIDAVDWNVVFETILFLVRRFFM